LLIAVVCLTPGIRHLVASSPERFWILIAVSLLSHILLDSWNSYGVHPFYPVDSRWYYGDSIFIFEPWIWLPLGIAAAANARSHSARLGLAGVTIALPLALALLAMIPFGAVFAIAAVGIPLAWVTRSQPARMRSGAALGSVALFVAGMFGVSAVVRGKALAALRPAVHGEILDIVTNPNPANPMCWSTIAVEKNERDGEYVLHRGTVSLARMCRGRTAWVSELRQPLTPLRDLASRDCWVRAWLQFGRVPVIADGRIYDLRYGSDGFTDMRLAPEPRATCPAHLTDWGMPRADLLTPSP
jgi:inner membrane protein